MNSSLRFSLAVFLVIGALYSSDIIAQTQFATASANGCAVNASGEAIVTITCDGIPPHAIKALEKQFESRLKVQDVQIKQLQDEANVWRDKYVSLVERLAQSGIDREIRSKAQQLVNEGRFEEAGRLLDQIIEHQERQVAELAQAYYDRASLYELQFQLQNALDYYAKAYRSCPDNSSYSKAYADLLLRQNAFAESEIIYEKLVRSIRNSDVQDSSELSELAMALNNLGSVYDQTQRLDDAERAYTEALQIHRELAKTNSGAYLPSVAISLKFLGRLYRDTQQLANAERSYVEALQIHRELAKTNPGAYQLEIATTLNDLGNLYRDTQRPDNAEHAYSEALRIQRELVKKHSGAHLPKLATTLNSLGILYIFTERPEDAEQALSEALQICRELMKTHRTAYLRDLASTLNNLGNLYNDTQRPDVAERTYSEALQIFRELAKMNPSAYLPDAALTLNNLGYFYLTKNRLDHAERALSEALQIRRELAKLNPSAYMRDVALTLNNLGILYHGTQRPTDAEHAYSEALQILRELAKTNLNAYLPDVAQTLWTLTLLQRQQGMYGAVAQNCPELYDIVKQLPNSNHALSMAESMCK